jgi:hypothetical protein
LQIVCSLARFTGIEPRACPSVLLLNFELFGAVIPIGDFLRQSVFDGDTSFFNPRQTAVADFLDMLWHHAGDGVTLGFLFQAPRDPS